MANWKAPGWPEANSYVPMSADASFLMSVGTSLFAIAYLAFDGKKTLGEASLLRSSPRLASPLPRLSRG